MKKWEKKEKNDAKDFEGFKQKGSGNTWSRPGDVKTRTFLIESKQTANNSYSITKKKWNKIYEEALFSFRIPILSLLIQDLELVVISKQDFINLTTKKRAGSG